MLATALHWLAVAWCALLALAGIAVAVVAMLLGMEAASDDEAARYLSAFVLALGWALMFVLVLCELLAGGG